MDDLALQLMPHDDYRESDAWRLANALVESGNRELFEELLTKLYEIHPKMIADLVTCYAGEPAGFTRRLMAH